VIRGIKSNTHQVQQINVRHRAHSFVFRQGDEYQGIADNGKEKDCTVQRYNEIFQEAVLTR